MITERMNKRARHVYYVCALLLALSTILLGWVLYDYLVLGDDVVEKLVPAIIDILLFAVLMIRNKKTMNKYESQNRAACPERDRRETPDIDDDKRINQVR